MRPVGRGGRWAPLRGLAIGLMIVASGKLLVGCEACSPGRVPETKPAAPAGLAPELAARVLARVGDRDITLGQYALTLERMDRLERLRYQTADRRKALLDEMINVELLAREAEQRGLADKPETRALLQQMLRDEVLRQLREALPSPEALPAPEVRAYYEAHRAEFALPELRRVEQIALSDRALAQGVLEQALKTDGAGWAALVARHSLLRGSDADPRPARSALSNEQSGRGPTPDSASAGRSQPPVASAGDGTESRPALMLAGDLGFVSAPGSPTDNERVPEPVRAAVFQIDSIGGVHPELVSHEGRFYVVRLAARTEARERSLGEVDSVVRVRMSAEQKAAAEADLLARLEREIPVQVDAAELERVPPPP
jgi:peptidyl-prolyl cis-trans isomerase C